MVSPALAPSQVIDRLDSPASYRTFITAGSANVKGSYTEITASAPRAYSGLYVTAVNSGALGNYLMDIAIGGAGSEVIIAENIPWPFGNPNENLARYMPLHIPAGVRVAMRVQCNTGSATLQVGVYGVSAAGQQFGYQRAIAYGVNTADSGGTPVDAGATADTKGAYVEITASLTASIRYLEVTLGNLSDQAAEASFLLDLAVGAGGSEVIKIPDISIYSDTTTDAFTPTIMGFPLELPAGARVAARLQSTTNNTADRVIDISIVGYS